MFSRTLFTVLAGALVLFGTSTGLVTLLVLLQMSVLIFVALATVKLWRVFGRSRPGQSVVGRLDGRSLWVHAVTIAFLTQGDLFLASFFIGGQEIANYGIAWRLGSIVAMPITALTSVVPGRIYEYVAGDRTGELRSVMARPMRNVALYSLAIMAGLVVAGTFGLRLLFGTEYQAAYIPMLIIGLGQLVNMWSGPVGHIMIGAGRMRALIGATTASAAVLAVLVPLGGRAFGPIGVAIAMSLATTTGCLVRNRVEQQIVGGRGYHSVWWFRDRLAHRPQGAHAA
jgi:O-antigen/teichoic acid export membrane protein